MRILHFADSHFSSKRLDECVRNFDWMVNYAADNDIDLFICAGDLMDSNTMINSMEYNAAINGISKMSEVAPVIIVRGNHDPDGSLGVFKKLHGVKYDIVAIDSVKQFNFNGKNGETISLLALPYINPIIFNAKGNRISSVFANAKEYYEDWIKTFKEDDSILYPRVVVAHLSVYGAELANNETIVANEVMLNVDVLDDERLNAVMLGHIHKREQPLFSATNIRYSAPHYRLTYSDKNNSVGFVVWDITKDRTTIDMIETPAKKMLEYHLSQDQTKSYLSNGDLPFEIEKDTDIKIVADIPEGMSHLFDKKKIEKMADGGHIKINLKTIPKQRVRSAGIVNKRTISGKVAEWLRVVGYKEDAKVFEKADLVESETRSGLI